MIPSTHWSTDTNGESSFVEIPIYKWGSSSVEEARGVDGFVRMWCQTIVAMVHLPVGTYPGLRSWISMGMGMMVVMGMFTVRSHRLWEMKIPWRIRWRFDFTLLHFSIYLLLSLTLFLLHSWYHTTHLSFFLSYHNRPFLFLLHVYNVRQWAKFW